MSSTFGRQYLVTHGDIISMILSVIVKIFKQFKQNKFTVRLVLNLRQGSFCVFRINHLSKKIVSIIMSLTHNKPMCCHNTVLERQCPCKAIPYVVSFPKTITQLDIHCNYLYCSTLWSQLCLSNCFFFKRPVYQFSYTFWARALPYIHICNAAREMWVTSCF